MLIDDMLNAVYTYFLFLFAKCGLHKKISTRQTLLILIVCSPSFSLSLSLVLSLLRTNFDATDLRDHVSADSISALCLYAFS